MDEIYFDMASTTPILPQVRDKLVEAFDVYGNPSSLHRKGVEAEKMLDVARKQVLFALGAHGGTLVFTGGGTEADNLAILGAAKRYSGRGKHLITSEIEHPAVLESFHILEKKGFSVTYIAPQASGDILLEDVLQAIQPDTILVSLMHVNNETGAILPIAEIGQALRQFPKILFHVDGIQAFGKIPFSLHTLSVDLYSISAHKIGGLKGTGALYIREGVNLDPLIAGGGQEYGLRSGTENVLGALAFGVAAGFAVPTGDEYAQMQALSDELIKGLRALNWILHTPNCRSPHIVHASKTGLRGEVLVHAFETKGLFVSTGSACSTRGGQQKASHVLRAMGLSRDQLGGAIRFSMGRQHTLADVQTALQVIREQTAWIERLL